MTFDEQVRLNRQLLDQVKYLKKDQAKRDAKKSRDIDQKLVRSLETEDFLKEKCTAIV